MNPHYDIIVVGAGLAGASAAMNLARDHRILLVDAEEPASGASGAGAGLINPLVGRRARPVWRVDEALVAVEETIEDCGGDDLYDDRGVVRPARDAEQAERFADAARERPDLAVWLSAGKSDEQFPGLSAPFGALRILRGGAIDIRRFVDRMIARSLSTGADFSGSTRLVGWKKSRAGISVDLELDSTRFEVLTRLLILALGDGFQQFSLLTALDLHRVKGQTIRIRRPEGFLAPCALPPVSGSGYIVPEIATWVLGSTYEHSFESVEPSYESDQEILRKTSRMIPGILDADVLDRRAGVRVTVPRRRLPMIGPLGGDGVWFFGGLGSKGLLHAPLIARSLSDWLRDPSLVPAELEVIVRK
jgi:glycine/D-amino acid oxidase-like deaminating enzyme